MSWNNIIPAWAIITVPKPTWATSQLVRGDRHDKLVEDVCKHGVGHPNQEFLAQYDPDGSKMMGVHGCDGCCNVR